MSIFKADLWFIVKLQVIQNTKVVILDLDFSDSLIAC